MGDTLLNREFGEEIGIPPILMISLSISKGYQIDSWEFGNELSGKGISGMVKTDQYGSDVIELREIINNSYRRFRQKPLLVAPGWFFDK
nr:heparanase-like protein 1 [Tanacetum cinerariifolium]